MQTQPSWDTLERDDAACEGDHGKGAFKVFLVTTQLVKSMGNCEKLETEICNLMRLEIQIILKDFFFREMRRREKTGH